MTRAKNPEMPQAPATGQHAGPSHQPATKLPILNVNRPLYYNDASPILYPFRRKMLRGRQGRKAVSASVIRHEEVLKGGFLRIVVVILASLSGIAL